MEMIHYFRKLWTKAKEATNLKQEKCVCVCVCVFVCVCGCPPAHSQHTTPARTSILTVLTNSHYLHFADTCIQTDGTETVIFRPWALYSTLIPFHCSGAKQIQLN